MVQPGNPTTEEWKERYKATTCKNYIIIKTSDIALKILNTK